MNLSVVVEKPTGISLTERALAKLRSIRADEADPELKLRVAVSGGGCSGFRYEFSLDRVTAADDRQYQFDDVAVLVDAISAEFLAGATVDFVDNLQGAQFTISNPNAARTCGCGSSFSV